MNVSVSTVIINPLQQILEPDIKQKIEADIKHGAEADVKLVAEANVKQNADKVDLLSFWKSTDLYLKESETMTLHIRSISIISIASGALIGAVVGAIGGVVAAPSGIGVAPAVAAGIAIGTGLGIGVGFGVKEVVSVIVIRRDESFIKWRKKAIEDQAWPVFKNFLKQKEEFNALRCQLSGEVPIVPVESPNGHIYEKEVIEKWLDEHPNQTCPKGGNKFTKADLVYSPTHAKKIIEIARRVIEESPNIPFITEGFKIMEKTITENNCNIGAAKIGEIAKDAFKHNLSEDQFQNIIGLAFRQHKKSN